MVNRDKQSRRALAGMWRSAAPHTSLLDKRLFSDVISECKSRAVCIYCGMPSEEIEHVIPRHTLATTYTVPACADCNRLASGYVPIGFKDKRDFIKAEMRRKYKKVLDAADWTFEDAEELDYTLRTHILAFMRAKQEVIKRLLFTVEYDVFSLVDLADM